MIEPMDNHGPAPPSQGSLDAGHEISDVPVRPLAGTAVAMTVLVAGSFLLMAILFKVFDYYQPLFDSVPHPLAQERANNTSPRIQVDPPAQKAELAGIEERLLTTYSWVDPEGGVARIPIARAIEILGAQADAN